MSAEDVELEPGWLERDVKRAAMRIREWKARDEREFASRVERLWREAGLPEWFLGNGGTNHKLYAFVRAVRLHHPPTPMEQK